ncbi:hypothetical protein KO507_11005 [Gilvimarinus agarilyticus]|uniref:hypothetical protein n=1 Tax=Gilvimarinus sp. 2_MG-2023 TaxID=3062666 RepID=UPI001C09E393|nr:hypothetical protein [Gilvimarinus sp. 2_MG-2023]MBU2886292.1 hypothetical protein [Gilvimarinus agarilyticus]MDO6570978.1 hypothetical protein [Gilvimarinus sp. 2_MG-2023]
MAKNVTDRYLLLSIYNTYYDSFCSFREGKKDRKHVNYVPIDCKLIGKKTGLHKDLVFGRLYYHLNRVHGYKKEDGSLVPFFYPKLGEDKHVINFPLLASILADMNSNYYKFVIPLALSMTALVISAMSIFI